MAGLLDQHGGQEPPDLQHAVSNGKTNGRPAMISAADAQAGHLKAGAKESPKRKKASKMAKLKQSKLDARREQWLAQVSGRKSPPSRDSSNGDLFHPVEEEHSKSNAFQSEASEASPNSVLTSATNGHTDNLEGGQLPVLRRWQTQPPLRNPHEASNAEEKPGVDVTSSKASKPHKGKKKKGARQKGAEEGGQENGHVDGHVGSSHVAEDPEDWEAAAEALGVVVPETASDAGALSENGSHSQLGGDESCVSTVSEEASPVGRSSYLTRRLAPEAPDVNGHQQGHRSGGSAWRQDDSHRPETLPRLEKFNSFPMVPHHRTGSMWEATISRTMWGSPAAPPTCPICTEELDLTDTSFVPCPCGFRLCLFCHHRIALDDGRCPGCRKAYQSEVEAEKYIQVPRSHLVRLKV